MPSASLAFAAMVALHQVEALAVGLGIRSGAWYNGSMSEATDTIIHCCACSRYVKLPENATEGDIVPCPFCGTKNRLATLTVFVGEQVVEA